MTGTDRAGTPTEPARPAPPATAPAPAPAPEKRILLIATMRNEGPFILEWVAYHRAIGFTDIVICSNDCVDESPQLLDRLQDLQLITHLPVEPAPGERPQLAAYSRTDALPVVGEASWIMVLDGDEFLNIHVGGGSVPDLLDAVPDATAILLNWRMFGHSGLDAFSDGFVTERFTRASCPGDPVNLSFKTLFTKSDAYGCRLSPHGPGYAHQERVAELRYVNGAGSPVSSRYATAQTFPQSEPDEVSWALAQVNHYNTRSRDDYLVKHHRGGGLDIAWDREACWAIFNKNDTDDRSILNKLPRTRAMLAGFLEDRELRLRHERCCCRYAEHIATLKQAGATGDRSSRRRTP